MWKLYLSLYLAKIVNTLIKILHLGSGFTWPGHIALTIFPDILKSSKFKFPYGVVLISGTNGKTTTSKLLTHILNYSGLKVVHNKTGANLLNGIVSEILLSMDLFGNHNSDIGVFEVDENNLPLILNYIDPSVLVLLNLSRDQLDRYGEVDLILERWMSSVKNLKNDTELVIDGTQSYFNPIIESFKGETTRFDDTADYVSMTSLLGKFNAKNVNAAVFTSMLIGIDEDVIVESLGDFTSAYGRGELVEYAEKEFQILLAKNPASFNNNLEALVEENISCDAVWIILNDNIPDGRDVSWIYDINPVLLEKAFSDKAVYISGTRSLDMAIRLQYAGVTVMQENIFMKDSALLQKLISQDPIENIVVLPNYSAMLNVRNILVGRKIL